VSVDNDRRIYYNNGSHQHLDLDPGIGFFSVARQAVFTCGSYHQFYMKISPQMNPVTRKSPLHFESHSDLESESGLPTCIPDSPVLGGVLLFFIFITPKKFDLHDSIF